MSDGRNHGWRVRASAFWGAWLGDKRRSARLVRVAESFAQGQGGSGGGTITSVIRDRHQAKAAYRLLDCEQVTHDAVIAGHCAQVLEQTRSPGVYLQIEDTTAVSFPGLEQATGLGPLGEKGTRGLWSHQTLTVKADWARKHLEPLGLLGQQVWARPQERPEDRPPSNGRGKESGHARQLREDRESKRWMKTLEQAGGAMEGSRWIYVADRESDIYELFQAAWANDLSFVIRATHPRALAGLDGGTDVLAAARSAPVKGEMTVALARPGQAMRVQVRSRSVTLRGPTRPGGRLENHTLHVVHARQVDAPAGQEPAEWILLTDLPVDTLAECEYVLWIYHARWLVEEFHKAMKTGLHVEDSQLSEARRLGALIGILSVVAVFLLQQKVAARTDGDTPLDESRMDESILAVLKKVDPPQDTPTRRWFWIAIAKLGGYHDRKSTNPGWLTLWRGWQTLMILTRGYDLANQTTRAP